MSHSHQFPPPPPSIPKPTLTPPPTTSKPLSAVMICRRPAEPSGGALNHPAIARRGALVSSTSCGTSERKSASVPARGSTSEKDGAAPAGASSPPPSVWIRRQPPSEGCQSVFR